MGEIADMMLDGTLDCETGEYLGLDTGFPVSSDPDSPHYYDENDYRTRDGELIIIKYTQTEDGYIWEIDFGDSEESILFNTNGNLS